jgi:hypothetical protein
MPPVVPAQTRCVFEARHERRRDGLVLGDLVPASVQTLLHHAGDVRFGGTLRSRHSECSCSSRRECFPLCCRMTSETADTEPAISDFCVKHLSRLCLIWRSNLENTNSARRCRFRNSQQKRASELEISKRAPVHSSHFSFPNLEFCKDPVPFRVIAALGA